MDDVLPLEAVTERDIDLLLLEEASVSPAFQHFLFRRVASDIASTISGVMAWHSVSDPALGESDLIVRGTAGSGNVVALLIENKIDAPPQPDQAARYAARGQAGIREGRWGSFRSLIVAPQRYLDSDTEAKAYHGTLSYETLCDWFKSSEMDRLRAAFKVSLLQQAIDQNRRGYNPKADEAVTRFFHDYWLLSQEHFPELKVDDPGPRTAASSWISLRPVGVSGKRVIWHKVDYGEVDLELPFAAADVDRLTEKYRDRLPPDVRIVKRGKSSGLRAKVPRLERFQPLSEQEREALAALRVALRLSGLMNMIDGA